MADGPVAPEIRPAAPVQRGPENGSKTSRTRAESRQRLPNELRANQLEQRSKTNSAHSVLKELAENNDNKNPNTDTDQEDAKSKPDKTAADALLKSNEPTSKLLATAADPSKPFFEKVAAGAGLVHRATEVVGAALGDKASALGMLERSVKTMKGADDRATPLADGARSLHTAIQGIRASVRDSNQSNNTTVNNAAKQEMKKPPTA